MMRKRRAQSILEYIIILSAITAAVIAAASSLVTPAVTTMFNDSTDVITNKTGVFRANMGSSN
ncbi:MAG: hypothetical protein PHV55_04595 [Candidatus Omnitrophica bacterium]|nr:hypothetical protein [Candidatus Omnitrophota bacterium]